MSPSVTDQVTDPSGTDDCARGHEPPSPVELPLPSRTASSTSERHADDDLLRDPMSDVAIDFNSQAGQREHAKKKKKPAAAPVGWGNNNSEEKKDDPAGDGNGGDPNGGGDAGNGGAGGGADGNGDNGGGDNPDDDWANFTTATSKKKKGKAGEGLPEIPTSDFGTDAFHEIKLGDDSAGLGSTDNKTNLGSWGNKWNTGGSSWDWSGGGGDGGDAAAAGDDSSNPWSKTKKKDKSTFSFGAFDETEPPKADNVKDDSWGFTTAGKTTEAAHASPSPEPIANGGWR